MPGKEIMLRPAAAPPAVSALPFPQDKTRGSEAAIVTIARWARRNRHVTVPLAIPPALWTAGAVLHAYPGAAGLAVLAAAAVTACVWFFAPHKWDRPAEQWYARLSSSLVLLWLILAGLLNPLGGPVTASILGALLLAGGVAWGYFWWQHKRPRGQRKRQKLIAQCDTWWLSHCHNWNLHGSRVIDAKLTGVTLQIRIQGIGGRHSLQHFTQVTHLIESAAEGHADVGLVRVAGVKGHPSQVDLFLKQENPLRGIVEYDMGLAPQSVHDPAAFGCQESGGWKMTSLRQNRFTNGMTRWGKSNDLLLGIANLSGCPDARVVEIDLKGGRSARPVLKSAAAEYVVTEVDEARMVLRMLTAEARAREMYAYDGNEQLLATPDVPALFTMIDETYGLTATEDGAGDAECRRHVATLASQGSGVEEYVWVYTQHGSLETSVGTEQIRGNLPWRTCYRVAEARHGAYVIPEYNKLDASRLEEKGTCYVKDGPDATPEQIRTPLMEHALLERIAVQNARLLGQRPPLRLYCGEQVALRAGDREVTWQEWWDTRWLRLHPAFHADSPQYQAAIADSPFAAADAVNAARAATPPVPSPEPGTGDAASAAARLAEDSAAQVPDDFRPDPRLVARLPQVIASQEDRFADALQAADSGSPATPKDLIAASGFSPSWVHGRLGALMEVGQVTQVTRGRYVTVPGGDVRRGLAEIRDRNARLNAEARQKISNAA
jgi:hypothetical protein